ncbi:MAG: UDP-glucose 4-epimerase GalE [Lentimicrobiaceae bacterium]|nr:UDP-glucose 4-epimerase GalE [Lentimicrobiaceae bacterium]
MKVLITGGTGYIGSHTIIEMIETGKFTPVCIDSCERSTPETIDRIEKITGIRVPFYQQNICDKDGFFQIFEEHKDIIGIIHFAAYKSVPESVEKPLEYYRNNLQSLENVLEVCLKYNIPNLIFSSSCSIYGEVANLPVNEDTPMGAPFCPYAHTKQIGEEMIRFFAHVHPQFNAVILRYFNPVGAHSSGLNGELSPDKPNNLMPIITQVGIGKMKQMAVFGTDYNTRDGSCIRDYVHVSDIADAHIKALEFILEKRNATNCEVFNLGSGSGVSVLEMIHAFEEITGIKLNYILGERRAGDIPAIYSDSVRAEQLLHWHCKYGLKDMVESAWKWEKMLSISQ